MTKQQVKIDMENPFIPARSAICRAADIALIFGFAACGLIAAILAVCSQIARA